MALQKPCISRPVEGRSARAAVQPFVPKTTNGPVELPEAPVVRRPTVVLVMTPQLGVEDCPLALQLVVPMLATPHSSRFERSPQAFLHRLEVDRELASAARRGSGASRDFGPAKTSWGIEDPQAAKQKCLISSRFPSLTRVPLSASAAERRLLSADAPEPLKLPRNPTGSYCSKIKSTPMRAIWLAFNGDHCAVPLSNVGASKSLDRGRYTFEPAQCHRRKSAPDVGEQSARRSSPSS